MQRRWSFTVIKPILTAIAVTMASAPAFATAYDDTVTFSVSAACSEIVGVKYPSKAKDAEWNNYLKCVEVLNYLGSKY